MVNNAQTAINSNQTAINASQSAFNTSQLNVNAVQSATNQVTTSRIDSLSSDVGALRSDVQAITAGNAKSTKMLSGGIAAASALMPSGTVGAGQSGFDVGVSAYNGQAAVGVSFINRSLAGGWNANGGGAVSTGGGAKPIVRLGFGRVFD